MVASANLGVLGGFSEDVVVNDPSVDDDRDGVMLKAAGRLFSSWDAIVILFLKCGEQKEQSIVPASRLPISASRTKSLTMWSEIG